MVRYASVLSLNGKAIECPWTDPRGVGAPGPTASGGSRGLPEQGGKEPAVRIHLHSHAREAPLGGTPHRSPALRHLREPLIDEPGLLPVGVQFEVHGGKHAVRGLEGTLHDQRCRSRVVERQRRAHGTRLGSDREDQRVAAVRLILRVRPMPQRLPQVLPLRKWVGVPDRSGRLGSRDGKRPGCVTAQVCIADLDLHGLAVVVHRVVDEADEWRVHPFSDLHPVRGFRDLEVVRSFRGGAARDGLEVVTHVIVRRLREADSEIEPPVVLVPGRVFDPNGQTRHGGRGGCRRGDRSRRLGGRDGEVRFLFAAAIDQARVAEPDLHRLAGGGDRVLNEREAHLHSPVSRQNDVGVDMRPVVDAFGGGASRNRLEVDLHRVPRGWRDRDLEHEVAVVLGGAGVRDREGRWRAPQHEADPDVLAVRPEQVGGKLAEVIIPSIGIDAVFRFRVRRKREVANGDHRAERHTREGLEEKLLTRGLGNDVHLKDFDFFAAVFDHVVVERAGLVKLIPEPSAVVCHRHRRAPVVDRGTGARHHHHCHCPVPGIRVARERALGVAPGVGDAHLHLDLLAQVGRGQRVGFGGRPWDVGVGGAVHPHPLVGERGGRRQPIQVLDVVRRRRQRLAHLPPTGNRRLAGGGSVGHNERHGDVGPGSPTQGGAIPLPLSLGAVDLVGRLQDESLAVNHQCQTLCGGCGTRIEPKCQDSVLSEKFSDRVGLTVIGEVVAQRVRVAASSIPRRAVVTAQRYGGP